jgi:hypothetical protein
MTQQNEKTYLKNETDFITMEELQGSLRKIIKQKGF